MVIPSLRKTAHHLVVRDVDKGLRVKLIPYTVKLLLLILGKSRKCPFGPAIGALGVN